mgnify:CR=1 FL=1
MKHDLGAVNLLFLCGRNQWRSPTAEKVFEREPGLAVRSRGARPMENCGAEYLVPRSVGEYEPGPGASRWRSATGPSA